MHGAPRARESTDIAVLSDMRWTLVVIALLGILIAVVARSPGWVAFGVIVGLVCAIGAALAFIDLQIRASSRPEHMTQGELDALKATLKPPADRLPPPQSS
jgi:hypothetical protein